MPWLGTTTSLFCEPKKFINFHFLVFFPSRLEAFNISVQELSSACTLEQTWILETIMILIFFSVI